MATGVYNKNASACIVCLLVTPISVFYSKSKSTQGIDLGAYTFDYGSRWDGIFQSQSNRMLYRNVNSKLSASAELIRRKSDDYTLRHRASLPKRDMGNIRLGLSIKKLYGAALDSTR